MKRFLFDFTKISSTGQKSLYVEFSLKVYICQGDGMKLLVIGNGGREHALAWKLAQSPKV